MTQTPHSSQKIPKLRFREFQDEWGEKKLGIISDVRDGTHDSPKYQDDGFPLLTSKNLLSNGRIDYENVSYISEIDYKNINKRSKVNIGDILFGMIGSIGNPVIVQRDDFAIKNVALIKEKGEIQNIFLIHYLNSDSIIRQFYRVNIGGAQKFIALGVIRDLPISFPSLPEQQKIASFLSSVDTRIEELREKKSLLEEYKKGVMQKIFAREIRFRDENGEEYGEWEERKLGEIALITTGSSNREDSNLDGQYAFFDRSQDIRSSNQYLFDTEAIIVPGEGQAFIPKYFIGKFDLHQRTYAIMNFANQDGKFLYYSIGYNSKHLVSHAVGSTVKSLRLPMFQKMPILLPTLPEQQKIAAFLSEIDSKIQSTTEQLEEALKWKKGLLQAMFV